MLFKRSYEMKVNVLPEQRKQLSSKDKILSKCQEQNVIAFDIYNDDELIGFAMFRQYEKNEFFLWNFAIGATFQNKHYGTIALTELINYMISEYDAHAITTTYIYGNEHAKYIYEKIGFIETDVVDEEGCHEVNMVYHIK